MPTLYNGNQQIDPAGGTARAGAEVQYLNAYP
jgi:hypothetical protein